MTYIMQLNYGYTSGGRKAYFTNRLLRIYPLYFGAMLFSLLVIFLLGEQYTSTIIFNLKLPEGLFNTLENVLLLITDHKHIALVPPAWALTVEILYYALIGLGLSKNKTMTWCWFTFGICYTIAIHLFALEWWDYGYFHPLAASLPFSVGALLFHYREEITKVIKPIAQFKFALAIYGLVLVNWVISYKLNILYSVGFYVNSLINVLLLAVLTNINVNDRKLRAFDKTLGDLSYPIYLMHWTIAVVVMYIFSYAGIELQKRTELFAIVSIPFMLFFGQLLVALIHNPIEKIRIKIKG